MGTEGERNREAVRACLIEDHFSAKQGIEDDNLKVLRSGGRIEGRELSWERQG